MNNNKMQKVFNIFNQPKNDKANETKIVQISWEKVQELKAALKSFKTTIKIERENREEFQHKLRVRIDKIQDILKEFDKQYTNLGNTVCDCATAIAGEQLVGKIKECNNMLIGFNDVTSRARAKLISLTEEYNQQMLDVGDWYEREIKEFLEAKKNDSTPTAKKEGIKKPVVEYRPGKDELVTDLKRLNSLLNFQAPNISNISSQEVDKIIATRDAFFNDVITDWAASHKHPISESEMQRRVRFTHDNCDRVYMATLQLDGDIWARFVLELRKTKEQKLKVSLQRKHLTNQKM